MLNPIYQNIVSQVSANQVTATQSNNQVSFSNALSKYQATTSGSSQMTLDEIFEKAAKTYNVPVALLKAVGKAESGFRADAVSKCGAQGIMQLMPQTAAGLGVIDPFDPEQNIMGGAKCLAQKLKQYNGDLKLTLASYNAGSGNVKKYGGIPPFPETRKYVEKVLGFMQGNLTTGVKVNATQELETTLDGAEQLGNTSSSDLLVSNTPVTGQELIEGMQAIKASALMMQYQSLLSSLDQLSSNKDDENVQEIELPTNMTYDESDYAKLMTAMASEIE